MKYNSLFYKSTFHHSISPAPFQTEGFAKIFGLFKWIVENYHRNCWAKRSTMAQNRDHFSFEHLWHKIMIVNSTKIPSRRSLKKDKRSFLALMLGWMMRHFRNFSGYPSRFYIITVYLRIILFILYRHDSNLLTSHNLNKRFNTSKLCLNWDELDIIRFMSGNLYEFDYIYTMMCYSIELKPNEVLCRMKWYITRNEEQFSMS